MNATTVPEPLKPSGDPIPLGPNETGPATEGPRSAALARVESASGDRPALSKPCRPLLRWFTWYSRRYIRRHFHSLRLSRAGLPPQTRRLPLVIYSNHASWWDPLVCLALKSEFFPERTAYAPIDAAALERYTFFRRLGFFGVEQGSRRGAAQFLRAGEAILRRPDHLLALTPQSRFADPRERPARFQPGLGHLAGRVDHALFVPLAMEYVFWEERLPEILVRFGEAVEVRREHAAAFYPAYWTALFEENLTATQDALAVEAQRRDPLDFLPLLRGGAGQGGIYDVWRAAKARWRGQPFNPEHGRK